MALSGWKLMPPGLNHSPLMTMNSKNTHPIEVAIVALLLALEAGVLLIRLAVVPTIALVLAMSGWKPRAQAQQEAATPVIATAAAVPLERAPVTPWRAPVELDGFTVQQLRRMARALGLKQLARAGRRADLEAALTGAAMAW